MIIEITTLRTNKAREEKHKRMLDKYMRLLAVHQMVKEALDIEPIEVDSVEEAAVWISLNELDIALDALFPGLQEGK